MNPRKPGRIFWVSTFVVGVFSPGTGKRRVNGLMQDLHKANKSLRVDRKSLRERNLSLISEVKFLRRELGRTQSENNMFLVQDEMNEVIRNMPDGGSPRDEGMENTIPLRVVNKAMARA